MTNVNTSEKLSDAAASIFSWILEKSEDFDTFIKEIHWRMDKVKTETVRKAVEEFDENLRNNPPDGWIVKRRYKRKIKCIFGEICFCRTKFIDQYGRTRYLCDELLGIAPLARFSSDAIFWMLRRVTQVSYAQTAKDFTEMSHCKISSMGVWYQVQKQAALLEQYGEINPDLPISTEFVCLESDGVLVALQNYHRREKAIDRRVADAQRDSHKVEVKTAALYVAKTKKGKRGVRLNVDLAATTLSKDKLEKLVKNRIKSEYDINYLKYIFYGSDAGSTYKEHNFDYIDDKLICVENSLDNFHLMQAIVRAFPAGNSREWLSNLAYRIKPYRMLKAIDKILPRVHGNRRQKVKDLRRYILNNIEIIQAKFNLGTMEGTIAKVWAKRMKKIGGAWSRHGANSMAMLLARIYSGKDPVLPRKLVFFTKPEMTKMKNWIQNLAYSVNTPRSYGDRYEPDKGKLFTQTAPARLMLEPILNI